MNLTLTCDYFDASFNMPDQPVVSLGRSRKCDVPISIRPGLDGMLSNTHAFLWQVGDDVYVVDSNSTNGTYVDGKRVAVGERRHLNDGSTVALGPYVFTAHRR